MVLLMCKQMTDPFTRGKVPHTFPLLFDKRESRKERNQKEDVFSIGNVLGL